MPTSLAFKISSEFSNLYCDLHSVSLSTKTAKELTMVKVCCNYFREEVQAKLEKRFGKTIMQEIRFSLPLSETYNPSVPNDTED